MEINKIYQGDCLDIMHIIEDKSINLIICDLPYGVTQNKADIPIDLDKLWNHYKRILKEDGTIVLTAQFPFTADLFNSNPKMFKYDLIWDKTLTSGFLNANRMPLRVHEHILVFYNKLGTYNPQKVLGKKNHSKGKEKTNVNNNYGEFGFVDNKDKLGDMKHPKSIINISKTHPSKMKHRTEKPVELSDWLVKTYSNEGDLVLDNCIGTGWTAVSCKKHNRNFIGIELDEKHCEIANDNLKHLKGGIDNG